MNGYPIRLAWDEPPPPDLLEHLQQPEGGAVGYTLHYTLRLDAGEMVWEVKNRGRHVCDCRSRYTAERIIRALVATGRR